jgi:methionyl-tRNA formyltransferase
MRIIFMGTPDFAVPSLEKLIENNYQVIAVVTATDKWGGRNSKELIISPVKACALKHQIPVLQPEKLKDENFLAELRSYQADLQIIVAFRMLPEAVWNMPRLGTFNLHASLLPQYRGAAPINWAVINGETETGATTFFLQHEIDTGDLIFQTKTPISPLDDAGTVYERLRFLGADLALKTVEAIAQGNYPKMPQPHVQDLKLAPKIFRETCEINWQKTRVEIHNFVRGLAPYPTAWTNFLGKNCKIFKTNLQLDNELLAPDFQEAGFEKLPYLTDNRSFLLMNCQDGYLAIEELQLEGKKRMNIQEFLRGNKL